MELPVKRWKTPRPKRRQARGRQSLWRRLLLSVLVLATISALVFTISKGLTSSSDPSISRQAVLELWKKSDWKGIRDASDKALQKQALDVFYLGMKGVASFYDAMSLPEGGDRDALIADAIVSIRKSLSVGSGDYRSIPKAQLEYVLAKAYYHSGGSDMDLAATYLKDAEALGYQATDTHEYLGMIESSLGNDSEAIAEFDKALVTDSSPMLRIAAASVNLRAGNASKAESLLKEAIAATQDAVATEKARLLLAKIYFDQVRYDDCRSQLDALIAENPDSAEAHFQLGLLYQARGDSIHARAEWRKAVSIDPMHAGARQKLAERS